MHDKHEGMALRSRTRMRIWLDNVLPPQRYIHHITDPSSSMRGLMMCTKPSILSVHTRRSSPIAIEHRRLRLEAYDALQTREWYVDGDDLHFDAEWLVDTEQGTATCFGFVGHVGKTVLVVP